MYHEGLVCTVSYVAQARLCYMPKYRNLHRSKEGFTMSEQFSVSTLPMVSGRAHVVRLEYADFAFGVGCVSCWS